MKTHRKTYLHTDNQYNKLLDLQDKWGLKTLSAVIETIINKVYNDEFESYTAIARKRMERTIEEKTPEEKEKEMDERMRARKGLSEYKEYEKAAGICSLLDGTIEETDEGYYCNFKNYEKFNAKEAEITDQRVPFSVLDHHHVKNQVRYDLGETTIQEVKDIASKM